MRRVLYIDFENVSRQGLTGIAKLTKNDLVRIFLGPKCSKMSLIDADAVFHCDATVELITNDQIGKNALDFIIMVHLGYDIAKKAGNAYYVISNDKGYEPAINEMKSMTGCTIERLPDVDAVIARGGEVKTGIFAFLHRTAPTPVADNTTQHEVLGRGAKKTTKRVVGSGASQNSGTKSGGRNAGGRHSGSGNRGNGNNVDAGKTQERRQTAGKTAANKTADNAQNAGARSAAKQERATAETAKRTARAGAAKQATAQNEEEIFRKGIETCKTKLEFHNYLAKVLDNKDHIQELYNRGKKLVEVDAEAVRRENGLGSDGEE